MTSSPLKKKAKKESQNTLRDLHIKALEQVKRMSEEEKNFIKRIVESSPNRVMYLGYIPINLSVSFQG